MRTKKFEIGLMMACGCAALGTVKLRTEREAFVGCGLHGCIELAETKPDLSGRTAVCQYGGSPVPSSERLAFFKHQPDQATDSYYCGCYGWD